MTLRSILIVSVLCVGLAGCSEDEEGSPAAPSTPAPAAVADLAVVSGGPGSLVLAWTSPARPDGGDATVQYELRHCRPGEEDAPFGAWTPAPPPADDAEPGARREHTVAGLTPDTAYVLRLRARVGQGTWSEVSNTVLATAAVDHDRTRPGPVPGIARWAATATSLTVAWAPAGDDSIYGRADTYELRYHATATDWEAMTPATGPVEPASKPGWLQTTLDGLVEDATYQVRVRAQDDAGHLGAPSPPQALQVTAMRVWYVNVEGTGDTPTVEEAVEQAHAGDVVLLAPGRYTWTNQGTGDPQYGMVHVPFASSPDRVGFTIRGEGGPEVTILDGERKGPVMVVTGAILGPGSDVPLWPGLLIEGLTFTGGVATSTEQTPGEAYAGAGLTMHVSNSTVRDCIVTGNESTNGGGMWYGGEGVPVIEDCLITDNKAAAGGGLFLINSSYEVTVRNTVISDNEARYGGGLFAYNVQLMGENVFVVNNAGTSQGGGVMVEQLAEGSRLVGCTIAGNEGRLGAAMRLTTLTHLELERCLIAFNSGSPAFNAQSGSTVRPACCLLYGHGAGNTWPPNTEDGGGNLMVDPLLCNYNSFTLQPDSPCLPGAHPDGADCGLIGAGGQGCVP